MPRLPRSRSSAAEGKFNVCGGPQHDDTNRQVAHIPCLSAQKGRQGTLPPTLSVFPAFCDALRVPGRRSLRALRTHHAVPARDVAAIACVGVAMKGDENFFFVADQGEVMGDDEDDDGELRGEWERVGEEDEAGG